jgi:hypothetical protein
MQPLRFVILLLLAAAIAVAPIAAGSRAASLSSLFQGGQLTAGSEIFTDWTLHDLTTTNAAFVNLDLVNVTPLVNNPQEPGVRFSAPAGGIGTPQIHSGQSFINLEFSFNVRTTGDRPLVYDGSIAVTSFSFFSSPQVRILLEQLLESATGADLAENFVSVQRGDIPGGPHLLAKTAFAPRSVVRVYATLEVGAPLPNDRVQLSSFEMRFSQIVPEPGLLMLAGVALPLLGVRRARISNRTRLGETRL